MKRILFFEQPQKLLKTMQRHKRMSRSFLLLLVVLLAGGCAPRTAMAPPSMNQSEEMTEDLSAIIESVSDVLGNPPENVIGFAAGYKKSEEPINGTENAALLSLYKSKLEIFKTHNMECAPSINWDEMIYYDEKTEGNLAAGYANGNKVWRATLGFNRYDALGNLDQVVNKTEIHIVSSDKVVKTKSPEEAAAEVAAGQFYAYWIVSLPDDNILDGVVYDSGADDVLEPVKKGILHFQRIGPGPASVDITVEVDGKGYYKCEGELTAGHYEVSFDPKDGKGEKVLNENWLYIPGDTPTQDWKVLVRNTYQIIYDLSHTQVSDGEIGFETHMEWHDIPIDWTVESEEALALGTELGFMGTYCLTYEYFDQSELINESVTDNDDESDTDITPGYPPTVLTEDYPIIDDDYTGKITVGPTLSFFRGAKDGIYKEDAIYMNLEYVVSMLWEGPPIDVPVGLDITPLPYASEEGFEKMGWGMLSRIARLDEKAVSDLISSGIPITIVYEDAPPSIKRLTIVIKPED